MAVTQSLLQLSPADKAAGLEEARSKEKLLGCQGPFPIIPLASPPLPPHPVHTAPEELLQCLRSKSTQNHCKYPFINPSPFEAYEAESLLCQNW